MRVRRHCVVVASAAALVGGSAGLAVPAAAAGLCGDTPPEPPVAVVASPGEDVDGVVDAGGIHLVYADEVGGLRTPFPMVTAASLGQIPTAGERFGASTLLAADAEDNCPVVVVGAPGWQGERGRVFVLRITSTGFDTTVVDQDLAGVEGTAEAGDRFGASLAWGGTSDLQSWLAVGAPGEDVGTGASAAKNAGVVHVFHTYGADAWGEGDVLLSQDQPAGMPGSVEPGDRFGSALSLTLAGTGLAVGSPGEAVGAETGAGSVTLVEALDGELPGNGATRGLTQDSKGVPGDAEGGDGFGSALVAGDIGSTGMLAIGAPGEDLGSIRNAGSVVVQLPEDQGFQALSQDTPGMAGTAERGDRFGSVLLAYGYRLVVGVPDENVGSVVDAGLVQSIRRSDDFPYALNPATGITTSQNSAGVPGAPGPGERFGSSALWATSMLWVGVPGEAAAGQVGAGSLARFTDDGNQWSFVDRVTQGTSGWGGDPEAGDGFGLLGGYGPFAL